MCYNGGHENFDPELGLVLELGPVLELAGIAVGGGGGCFWSTRHLTAAVLNIRDQLDQRCSGEPQHCQNHYCSHYYHCLGCLGWSYRCCGGRIHTNRCHCGHASLLRK